MKKYIAHILCLVFVLVYPPSLPAKQIEFAVLSDIHYAVKGEDKGIKMLASGKEILLEVIEEINGREIDFVIFAGDLFINPYYPELRELPALLEAKLKKPYFVVVGNHDRAMDKDVNSEQPVFTPEEFTAAFEKHPYKKYAKRVNPYWSINYNGYHLIGLDSTRYDSWGGSISKKQIAWLKKDLKKNKNKFTIIFVHHPLIEFYPEHHMPPQIFIENSPEMLDIVVKNRQIKFVVSGHTHFPAVIFRGGIHHLSMPSIITYPCKYAVFTVDEDEVFLQTIPVADHKLSGKAKKGLIEGIDWRGEYLSEKQLIDVSEGMNSYSFKPRQN